MTFTRSQEEDKTEDEHQGNGSDSKVTLVDPTREPQSRRKRLEEPNIIFLS